MVDYQKLELPLWGGLDSKTDPKSINPNKLEVVENGDLTNPGAIHKRTGASKLSTSATSRTYDHGDFPELAAIHDAHANGPTMLISGDLTGTFDGYNSIGRGLGYSPQITQWNDLGRLQNVEHTIDFGSSSAVGLFRAQVAYVGTIAGYIWETTDDSGLQQIFITIRDTASDTLILPETNLTFPLLINGIKPKVTTIDGEFFLFVYQDNSAGNKLNWLQINPANPSDQSISGTITMTTNGCWDLDCVPNGQAVLAYQTSTPNITIIGLEGGITIPRHTLAVTPKTAICLNRIREASPGQNNFVLAWQDSSTNNVNGLCFEYGMSPSTLPTSNIFFSGASNSNIIGLAAGREPAYESNFPGTDVIRFFTEAAGAGSGDYATQHVLTTRLSTSDGHSQNFNPDLWLKVGLYSKPFLYNNQLFVQLVSQAITQPSLNTFYLWTSTTRANSAPQDPTNPFTTGYITYAPDDVVWQGDAYGYQAEGYLSTVQSLSTNSFVIGAPKAVALVDDNVREFQAGSITYTFDQPGYSCAKLGQNLYVAGGVVQQHDGKLQEEGFFMDPDELSGGGGSGGFMSDGTYSYVCIYEMTDQKGQLQRSAPSPEFTLTLSGGTSTQSAGISVPTCTILGEAKRGDVDGVFLNLSNQIYIHLFRTTAGGATYHSTGVRKVNNQQDATIAASDRISDTDLQDNEIIYYQSAATNSDLLNERAPATKILVANELRLFCVPMDDPKSIWYSQPWNQGTAVSWSGNLAVSLPDLQYDLTALAVLDDKLVAFTPYEIRMLDATAFDGGSLNEIQIPTDVGAVDQRSIVVCQLGVFFKSAKGIYLLDRGLQTSYVGADVEAYNDQDIVSAVLMPNQNQIRFITSGGVCLVLDYYVDPNSKPAWTWAVYTNYDALDAHVWNGTYTRFRDDGLVLKDDSTRWTDDELDSSTTSYNLRVKTGWLHPAGLQGYERTRRAAVLGERHTDGYLTIDVSQDYKSAVVQEEQFDTAASMGVGDELCQHQFRLANQNCEAVQLDITVEAHQSTDDAPNTEQGLSLTNLALEVGGKKGIFRLPNSKIK